MVRVAVVSVAVVSVATVNVAMVSIAMVRVVIISVAMVTLVLIPGKTPRVPSERVLVPGTFLRGRGSQVPAAPRTPEAPGSSPVFFEKSEHTMEET